MRHVEAVQVVKNVLIPMRDGIRLAADLYTPDPDPGRPLPVVMEYIPYRKDEVSSGASFYEYFPQHGYILARVDIRGTGASEGVSTDEYMPQEQLDGYDAVEWLAAQAFCDGHVNLAGMSYGGCTALQVATQNPPHLTSIIPTFCTDDRYIDDCHYRGGLLRKYYDVGYYANRMIVDNALPPYPEWSGEDWARIWEEHIAHNEPYLFNWLEHQTDGSYWRQGSVRDIADRIACPVFMIDGWCDGYANVPLRLYQALRVPKKVIIGPWNHANPDVAIPGPRIDYLHEVMRWLDHWCKGEETGIMDEAPVVFYVRHPEKPVVGRLESAGEWRGETDWPAPGAAERVLYLNEGGMLTTSPDRDGTDSFEYVATVGVTGGLWSGGLEFGLPGDQRPDEAFSLVYTSMPLEEDLHVTGRPRATLYVSSSASVIGFAASLSDVAPDGTSQLVAKGMLNATRRNSLTDPEPLLPGEMVELDIGIDTAAWLFPEGHRIRLSISNADWPNVWPTPELAISNIYWGGEHRSQLVLPTLPQAGSAPPPTLRPSPKAVAPPAGQISPPRWEIVSDLLRGHSRARIAEASDSRVNDTTVVHRECSLVADCDASDPASASARGQYARRITRPNFVVEGRSDVMVQASATHFHVTIDLELWVNEKLHHSRGWMKSFPRTLL